MLGGTFSKIGLGILLALLAVGGGAFWVQGCRHTQQTEQLTLQKDSVINHRNGLIAWFREDTARLHNRILRGEKEALLLQEQLSSASQVQVEYDLLLKGYRSQVSQAVGSLSEERQRSLAREALYREQLLDPSRPTEGDFASGPDREGIAGVARLGQISQYKDTIINQTTRENGQLRKEVEQLKNSKADLEAEASQRRSRVVPVLLEEENAWVTEAATPRFLGSGRRRAARRQAERLRAERLKLEAL